MPPRDRGSHRLTPQMYSTKLRSTRELRAHIDRAISKQHVFAGRYLFVAQGVQLGQAWVQFARDASTGAGDLSLYAVKFFRSEQHFANEEACYQHPRLQHVLPPLQMSCANSSNDVCSEDGYVYPPFLVMERGVTASEVLSAKVMSFALCNHVKLRVLCSLNAMHDPVSCSCVTSLEVSDHI